MEAKIVPGITHSDLRDAFEECEPKTVQEGDMTAKKAELYWGIKKRSTLRRLEELALSGKIKREYKLMPSGQMSYVYTSEGNILDVFDAFYRGEVTNEDMTHKKASGYWKVTIQCANQRMSGLFLEGKLQKKKKFTSSGRLVNVYTAKGNILDILTKAYPDFNEGDKTRQELAIEWRCCKDTAWKRINKMVKQGTIEFAGERGGTHYFNADKKTWDELKDRYINDDFIEGDFTRADAMKKWGLSKSGARSRLLTMLVDGKLKRFKERDPRGWRYIYRMVTPAQP